MTNTVLPESTDSMVPLSSVNSMTPLDFTNSVSSLDSVNNDSVTPQPTKVPSFLGKDLFFFKLLPGKYYGNNRSGMYIRTLLFKRNIDLVT